MNCHISAVSHPKRTASCRTYNRPLPWMVVFLLACCVASASAQHTTIKATLSGTNVPSLVDLQTGTSSSEYDLTGTGSLGLFTLRVISAGAASPQSSNSCSGLYFPILAGQAVLRTSDGSLLKLNLTGGSDCIDLVAMQAHCIRAFQTIGGTGRFKDASGTVVTLTMTVSPVVAPNVPFFAVTGDLSGTVFTVDIEDSQQNKQQ